MALSFLGLLMFLAMVAVVVVGVGFGISKLGSRPSLDRDRLDRLREVMNRLADAEARLDELADTEARLGELEERVDVSERVLADVRAHKEIPPGAS